MDVTVNIPEVVAEVRALFERYEQALIDKNVEVLDATRSTSMAMALRRSTRTAWRARRGRAPRRSGSVSKSSRSAATWPP